MILRQQMSADDIALMKRTVARGATDDELALFIHQIQRTGLDPLSNQIYFIKRRVRNKDTGNYDEVASIQTGIDGYRLIAERTGKYEGQEGPFWCGEDGVWKDVWTSVRERPFASKVGIVKRGARMPVWGVVYWDEQVQRKANGEPNQIWSQLPKRMLANAAERLAFRKAFPNELSAIHAYLEGEEPNLPEPDPHAAIIDDHPFDAINEAAAGVADTTKALISRMREEDERQEAESAKRAVPSMSELEDDEEEPASDPAAADPASLLVPDRIVNQGEQADAEAYLRHCHLRREDWSRLLGLQAVNRIDPRLVLLEAKRLGIDNPPDIIRLVDPGYKSAEEMAPPADPEATEAHSVTELLEAAGQPALVAEDDPPYVPDSVPAAPPADAYDPFAKEDGEIAALKDRIDDLKGAALIERYEQFAARLNYPLYEEAPEVFWVAWKAPINLERAKPLTAIDGLHQLRDHDWRRVLKHIVGIISGDNVVPKAITTWQTAKAKAAKGSAA
jgi:phage recombination protein Bet